MATMQQLITSIKGLGIVTLIYELYRWHYMDIDWNTAGYIIPRTIKPLYFKNRIIWITGASSGIGEALCRYLISLGVGIKLIISSRRKNVLKKIKYDIIRKYRNEIYATDIYILPINLTKKNVKYYERKYELIKQYFNVSSIDILINNAGIGMRSTFDTFNPINIVQILQTNLVSPIILTKLVLTDIINNNKNENLFGHICNIGSLAPYLLSPTQSAYNASKSGLLTFGVSLAQELDKYQNVMISDVLPGPVATDIDSNLIMSNGLKANRQSKIIQDGMTSERCAELICIAISNKIRESWPSKGPSLYIAYIAYYAPWFLINL
eukprot:246673_1